MKSQTSKNWKLTEITDSGQCRSLRLPNRTHASKVVKLIYTNSGVFVLALTSNALHKLWKWPRSDQNPSGKLVFLPTQMWQPASGIVMNNDVGDTNPEEVDACIALSVNASYVMSASCGSVSLFNMMAFKVMKTFMLPLPAATFLPFHPQDNNIIAIGMEDSSIQIYTVRVDEVKAKLKGHQKKITGLAFSRVLNVLVSSGADAQMRGTSESQKLYNQEDLHYRWGIQEYSFIMIKFTCWLCMRASFAIYDASKLEHLCYCSPHGPLSAPISSAIYSCDSVLVYASF